MWPFNLRTKGASFAGRLESYLFNVNVKKLGIAVFNVNKKIGSGMLELARLNIKKIILNQNLRSKRAPN